MNEYDLLASIGVSFDRDVREDFSPEEVLVELVDRFDIIENRRLLSLTITAFQNMQDLFRPDSLSHLVKRLDSRSRSVLGGIIFREGLRNAARWNRLKKLLVNDEVYIISSERLLELRGSDPYFQQFGIHLTPVVVSAEKKIVSNDWLIKNNTWFASRILMGPSIRADIYTIRKRYLEANPYRIAKRFNLSFPSVTKIWNDMIYAQSLGI